MLACGGHWNKSHPILRYANLGSSEILLTFNFSELLLGILRIILVYLHLCWKSRIGKSHFSCFYFLCVEVAAVLYLGLVSPLQL